jgi:hypothetical protein
VCEVVLLYNERLKIVRWTDALRMVCERGATLMGSGFRIKPMHFFFNVQISPGLCRFVAVEAGLAWEKVKRFEEVEDASQ